MTAPVSAVGDVGEVGEMGARASRRRWLWPTVVGVSVLLAVAYAAVMVPRTRAGDLDPDSATPAGSRALAQILRGQGVDVQVVRHSEDLTAAGGTTIVVVRPELVPLDILTWLGDVAGDDLVLVEPDLIALDAVRMPATPAGDSAPAPAAPGCAEPDAVAAGRITGGGRLYRLDNRRGVVCYPAAGDNAADDAADNDGGAGSVVTASWDRTRGPQRITVLGQGDLLRNRSLAQEGNAAFALRTLGRQPRLQWYVPDPAELTADQAPTLRSLLPPWVTWVALQLAIAAGLALVWRARRLGPLIVEPLPVVVRAAQTQEGRARLYRQAGGRDRAAATLRTTALRRWAKRFDVPADADPSVVADVIADATGRDRLAVRRVLTGPPPHDDGALVRLADELDEIHDDVSS